MVQGPSPDVQSQQIERKKRHGGVKLLYMVQGPSPDVLVQSQQIERQKHEGHNVERLPCAVIVGDWDKYIEGERVREREREREIGWGSVGETEERTYEAQ
jgi:hypothetical protein